MSRRIWPALRAEIATHVKWIDASDRDTVCVCLPPEAIWFSLRSFHSKCAHKRVIGSSCWKTVLDSNFPARSVQQKNIIWMRVESKNTFTHLPAYATVLFGITTNGVQRTHAGIQSQQWARGMRNGMKKRRMNTYARTHIRFGISMSPEQHRAGMNALCSSVYVYRPYRAVEHFNVWNAVRFCLWSDEKKIDR